MGISPLNNSRYGLCITAKKGQDDNARIIERNKWFTHSRMSFSCFASFNKTRRTSEYAFEIKQLGSDLDAGIT